MNMRTLFLKTNAAVKTSSTLPSRRHGKASKRTVSSTIETLNSVEEITPKFPASMKQLLASAIDSLLARADADNCPYSPYIGYPYTDDENMPAFAPRRFVNVLMAHNAKVEIIEGASGEKEIKPVNYSVLSEVTGLDKGEMTALDKANIYLKADQIESWRLMLVNVGKHTPELSSLASTTPEVILAEAVLDLKLLRCRPNLGYLCDYAMKYCGMDKENALQYIDQHRPNARTFYSSMVNIWREEIELGTFETYHFNTFYELISSKTALGRLGRSVGKFLPELHGQLPDMNSRVSYPKTYREEYKRRYGSSDRETGLTADMVMAYCFYLGLNPLSVVHWFANKELHRPGYFNAHTTVYSCDVVEWIGFISPIEYQKLLDAIISSLVSDQKAWTVALLGAQYVFKDLPSLDSIRDKLCSKDGYVDDSLVSQTLSVAADLLEGMPAPSEYSVKDVGNLVQVFGLYPVHSDTPEVAHAMYERALSLLWWGAELAGKSVGNTHISGQRALGVVGIPDYHKAQDKDYQDWVEAQESGILPEDEARFNAVKYRYGTTYDGLSPIMLRRLHQHYVPYFYSAVGPARESQVVSSDIDTETEADV